MKFTTQKHLMFSILLLLIMIAFDAPLWIALFSFLLIGYKILSETKNFPVISRKMTTALSLLLLGFIYLQFKTFLGQEASTTLLMGLTALKIVDYEKDRDHKYIVILGFMLLAMKPLFSLDLYWAPLLLAAFFGLWMSMLSPRQRHPLQFVFRIFVLSIPFAIVLFLVFPRVILPWAKKASAAQSKTGFSETLSPGSTSELVETNILVFRAKFYNSTPKQNQLYWRGAVLNHSDGLSWRIEGERQVTNNRNMTGSEGLRIKYDVYLEPGNQNYIFALETPNSILGETFYVRSLESSVYRSNLTLEKTFLYHGISNFNSYDTTAPSQQDLQIPKLPSKVQSFVSQYQHKENNEKINILNHFFRTSNFSYTLQPGVYGDNELEEFLFVRKQGFCEHFAGGYATLARAMGVPARVVVGFQGGIRNNFGDFWRVSTKDAHAWVEVYLNDRWTRVDPTALVTPLRIELGAQQYFDSTSLAQTSTQKNFKILYDQAMAWIENINYTWMAFLIDFDRDYQKNLLDSFKDKLGWILLSLITLIISVSFISQWILKRSKETNEYQDLLNEVFKFGKRQGLVRHPHESPEQYLKRLSNEYPQLRDFSSDFLESYDLSFYQNVPQPLDKKVHQAWSKARSLGRLDRRE